MNKEMYDRIRLESLTSSPIIDLELHPLINLLMAESLSWFSAFSNDQELFIEILRSFSLILSNIENRCIKMDWVLLLVKDVPELLVCHLNDWKRASSMSVVGKSTSQIFHGLQPHYGIDDPNEYTRKVSEMMINALLSQKECESDLIRYFLREILSQVVLIPLIDQLSEPDTFYEIFLAGTSRNTANTSTPGKPNIIKQEESKSNIKLDQKWNEQPDYNFNEDAKKSLFTLKNSSNRKPITPKGASGSIITNSIMSGFNKLTSKGIDRVSSGFDKLRTTFKSSVKEDDLSPRKPRSRFVSPKRGLSKEPSSSPEKDKQAKISFKMQKGHKKKLSEKLDDFLSSPSLPKFFAPRVEKSRKPVDITADVESGNISDSAIFHPLDNNDSNHRRTVSEAATVSMEKVTQSPRSEIFDTESEASILDEKLPFIDEVSPSRLSSSFVSTTSLFDSTQPLFEESPQIPKESNSLYDYWKMLLVIYSESSLGPTKIGFLDLSRYSGVRLEDGIINLINGVFRFSERAGWIWTQLIFFLRPIANYIARSTINRKIVNAVYHIISPPQTATYLALIREIIWPNGMRPSVIYEKSAEEKARTKVEAAQRILKIFQDAFGTVLGAEMVKDSVSDIINCFSVKDINKHLIFLLLDLFVVHFLPESIIRERRA